MDLFKKFKKEKGVPEEKTYKKTDTWRKKWVLQGEIITKRTERRKLNKN